MMDGNMIHDEFYTCINDISNRIEYYYDDFYDKIVYCNCDIPGLSKFWEYFHLNFEQLGLRKLISTHYSHSDYTYKMEYCGGDDSDILCGVKTYFSGNGDFRSCECDSVLCEADIVVSNPPFSLFEDYVDLLINSDVRFLIVGPLKCYKSERLKDYFECHLIQYARGGHGRMVFRMSDDYPLFGQAYIDNSGHKCVELDCCAWFTNMF